jgi:hypothetical protein
VHAQGLCSGHPLQKRALEINEYSKRQAIEQIGSGAPMSLPSTQLAFVVADYVARHRFECLKVAWAEGSQGVLGVL